MAARVVRIAPNFARNLEDIRRFLADNDAAQAFDTLLDSLFSAIIPTLEQFPQIGRDFLARSPASVEGQARLDRIFRLIARRWHLREYISGDYLILYAVSADSIGLLSIKHHRQLSFDFRGHWPQHK